MLFERMRRSERGSGILKPEFLTTDHTDGTDNKRGRLGAWGRGGGRGVFDSRPGSVFQIPLCPIP